MKKQKNKKIELKKITITRINPQNLNQLKGGDCIPTEHEAPSLAICPPTIEVY